MAEHTPTPWAIDADYPNCVRITDSHGHDVEIAECSLLSWDGSEMTSGPDATDEANATFIVKACNSHDALVKALDGMIKMYADMVNSGDCGFWNPEEVKEVIASRAALSLASHDQTSTGDAS